MRKILSLLAAVGVMFYFSSCSSDDDPAVVVVVNNEVITGLIEEDMTLTSDRIWELSGRVFVTGGATLTIESGTIIKGQAGTGSNSSGLYITRDGKINAVGTAVKPIIFTSVDDDIQVGQLSGTNLTPTDNQLWGGIVILGNAPISPDAGTTAQIEGVPAAETLGQYGGTDTNDNRGVLKYISIRHGGTSIDAAAGKDINGLTLGGVGSGTQISYIEIFANFDDGVEFFGGSVNVSHLLVYGVGDDGIDIDQAYSGTINNFMVYTSTAASSDEGFEIDGPEGSENSTGKFTITNGTVISVDGGGSAADFKSKAQGTMTNVKWSGFDGGATVKFRASFNDDCSDKSDAYKYLVDGTLVLTTVNADAVKVYTESTTCTLDDADATAAAAKVGTGAATGVSDDTVFQGWSYASLNDLL
jgi:hypothetical protein